jgi:Bacterial Ig-like domain (group 2)
MTKCLFRKILFLGIACLLLFPQWVGYAVDVIIDDPTPDLKAPLLNNITVSSQELTPSTPIKVIADISDGLSGFKSGYITYIKPNNQSFNVPFVLNSISKMYEATITVPETGIEGEWKATSIYLVDNKENHVYLYHQTNQSNGGKVDFSNIHLNVTGVTPPPEPTDKEAPILHAISVTSQQVKVNEKIEVEADVTDNESGISSIHATYKKPNGATSNIYLSQSSSGLFVGSLTIGKYEESGEWTLTSVYVRDNVGNSKYYYNYMDVENVQKTFEHCSVNVSETVVDKEAPNLQSISVKYKQVKANEKIEIIAEAADNESGISSIRVEYVKPNGTSQFTSLYKNFDGKFIGSISVGQFEDRGNRVLKSVYLEDAVGNDKTIISYVDVEGVQKDFADCTVEVIGTTPDWEGPEIVHREISVDQISPTQAAVKLSIEIRDPLSGIANSSLSGTYRKPSGRILNLDFKKINNKYTALIPIDKYDELGKWTLETLSIRDAVGNYNSLSNRLKDSTFADFDIYVMGKITVTPGVPESIRFDSPKELISGQTYQLKPFLRYSNPEINEKDITNDSNTKYTSTNSNLLTVSSAGLMAVPSGAESGNVFVEVSYGKEKEQVEIKINKGKIDSVLQISPLSTVLHAGNSEQMKVVEVFDGVRKDITTSSSGITYTSSNPSLVTVSGDGLIQAAAGDIQGSAVIQIKYNNLISESTVKVTKPYAKSLSLSHPEENLSLTNNRLQLIVKAFMSDGTTKDVSNASSGTKYVSSNSSIAQVSPDGYIKIPSDAKSGDVTITIISNNLVIKSILHVTGNPELININLDSISTEMNIGDQKQISLQSEWSDGTVKEVDLAEVLFNSSRTDRVNITPEGLLQSISSGTSDIDVVYEGKTFRKTVKVLPPPTIVNVFLENSLISQMKIGEESTIPVIKAEWSNGEVKDVDLKDVKLSSSRPDRVSITETGLIKALSSGSSNINIEHAGKIVTESIKVEAGPTISSIFLDTPFPVEMKIGDKYKIGEVKAKLTNGEETIIKPEDLIFTSTRSDRISVAVDGTLTALSSGSSYIDIVYQGKSIRAAVKAVSGPSLTGIYLGTAMPVTLKIGEEFTISNVKAKWSNGEETILENSSLSFTSSRQDRILISAEGKLIAKSVGTSNISILYSGKVIQVSVKVVVN